MDSLFRPHSTPDSAEAEINPCDSSVDEQLESESDDPDSKSSNEDNSVSDSDDSSVESVETTDEDDKIFEEGQVNSTLYEEHEAHCRSGLLEMTTSPQFIAETGLLALLKKHKTNLKLYDDIMKWAHETITMHGYKFEEKPRKRKTVMTKLKQQFGLTGMDPFKAKFSLPSHESKFGYAVKHSVAQACKTMLVDPRLAKDENYIFADQDTPFLVPDPDPDKIRDVQHTESYRQAYPKYVQDPNRDVLCPPALFVDKTHITTNGNCKVEPVGLCLCIYNKETRLNQYAWRTVGYLINQDNEDNTSNSLKKLQNYHACLYAILEELVAIQRSGGIKWKLHFKGTDYVVHLKFPIFS